MPEHRRIIGILGVAGSGKTLVSRHLVQEYGFTRTRFADPIKTMLKAGLGLTDEELDGEKKMQPIARLCNRTPRHFMQTLGTEWGRRLINQEIWINAWRNRILDIEGSVVIDDVRFPNEALAVRAAGGELWRVYRPGLNTQDHISERANRDITEDVFITNATSIDLLLKSVDVLMIKDKHAIAS